MARTVKKLPAMWEIWVQSLGWEDPLEEGMATLSSILAWRIPMNREAVAWRATVHGVEKSQTRLGNQAQHSTRKHWINEETVSGAALSVSSRSFVISGNSFKVFGRQLPHQIIRELV